jgi:hypothetical protein
MDLPFAIDADINAYFSKYSIKLRKKFEIYSQSKSKSFKNIFEIRNRVLNLG